VQLALKMRHKRSALWLSTHDSVDAMDFVVATVLSSTMLMFWMGGAGFLSSSLDSDSTCMLLGRCALGAIHLLRCLVSVGSWVCGALVFLSGLFVLLFVLLLGITSCDPVLRHAIVPGSVIVVLMVLVVFLAVVVGLVVLFFFPAVTKPLVMSVGMVVVSVLAGIAGCFLFSCCLFFDVSFSGFCFVGLEAVSAWVFVCVVFVVVICLLGCLTWVGVCFGCLSGVMMMFGG
jgi:hypothetical protein